MPDGEDAAALRKCVSKPVAAKAGDDACNSPLRPLPPAPPLSPSRLKLLPKLALLPERLRAAAALAPLPPPVTPPVASSAAATLASSSALPIECAASACRP